MRKFSALALVSTPARLKALAQFAEPHPTARPFYDVATSPALFEAVGQSAPSPAPTADTFTAPVSRNQAILDAAAAITAACKAVGQSPSSSAVAMMVGQCLGESMFGRLVTGYGTDMAGTNNYGSVVTTSSWQTAHTGAAGPTAGPGWGSFAHTDTLNGKPYVSWFRVYPSQLAAAQGYLNTISYEGTTAALGYIAQGPAAFAAYLSKHGYFTAPVATYTTMLTNGQATVTSALAAATSAGLTAADPTAITSSPTVIAPITKRLTAGLLANPVNASGQPTPLPNPEGIVWFNGPPAGPGLPGIPGLPQGLPLATIIAGAGALALVGSAVLWPGPTWALARGIWTGAGHLASAAVAAV